MPRLPHSGQHRLCHEELMFQIDLHAAVPVLRGDLLDRVASIVSGIIHEDVDCRKRLQDLAHDSLKCADVGKVAVEVLRRRTTGLLQSLDEGFGCLVLNIEEDDLRLLPRESLNDGFTDAARSACDDYDSVLEARVYHCR